MVLGLLLTVAIARYLGVIGFGEYALVFAYVAAFDGVLNNVGLHTICLREIARRPAERAVLVSSAATLQSIVAGTTYVLMIGSLFVVRYPEAVRASVAIYGLSLFVSVVDVLALPFQADLQLRRLVAPAVASTGLNFALALIVLVRHGPLFALVAAALVALLVQAGWIGILSVRRLDGLVRPSRSGWGMLAREALPLAGGTVASTLMTQGPLIALSFTGMRGVGLYNAANKIPQQLLLLPMALRSSTFPLLSRSWVTDRPRFGTVLTNALAVSMLIGIPLAVGMAGISEGLVSVLFGPSFEAAAPSFALLVGCFLVLIVGIAIGEAMIAAGLQRLTLVIQLFGLVLLLGLLYLLVPTGGATGAAVAVLASYAGITVAATAAARHRLGAAVPVGLLWSGLGVAAVAVLLMLLLRGWNPLGAAGLSALSALFLLSLFWRRKLVGLWRSFAG
jgi:O-antigen/teichoic acid export membrane protein